MHLWYELENPRWYHSRFIVFTKFSEILTSDFKFEVKRIGTNSGFQVEQTPTTKTTRPSICTSSICWFSTAYLVWVIVAVDWARYPRCPFQFSLAKPSISSWENPKSFPVQMGNVILTMCSALPSCSQLHDPKMPAEEGSKDVILIVCLNQSN